jgi:hypothetical protein
MTERDSDYERWLLALNSLQEVSSQYQALLRNVQNGFSTLSLENATIRQRLALIETKVHAMDATFQQLLPHLAAIAAYVVAQQQRPVSAPRPRQSRRANGE